jgi:hypothetical protein
MTEAEWLAADDPTPMLRFLRDSGRASDRKLRWFAVACCRRVWNLLTDERSRRAVELAERFADREASPSERKAARSAALDATAYAKDPTAAWAAQRAVAEKVATAVWGTSDSLHAGAPGAVVDAHGEAAYVNARAAGEDAQVAQGAARTAELLGQACLLRDIFGPLPFRSVSIAAAWVAWNECTVRRLAEAVYTERAFERMPVLADAMEEAGCDDAEMLAHCRGPGPHTKGCWVVDLLLGRG